MRLIKHIGGVYLNLLKKNKASFVLLMVFLFFLVVRIFLGNGKPPQAFLPAGVAFYLFFAQFFKLWMGAGIRPPRAINLAGEC